MDTIIVWFRQDLRIDDNPALKAATESGASVLPVYIWSPDEEGVWTPGAATKVWLHFSLCRLDVSLRTLGSQLVIRKGSSYDQLRELIKGTQARAVYWNDRYEPDVVSRDQSLMERLRRDGVEVRTFNSALLFEPDRVLTNQGRVYKVFTPFWNQCQNFEPMAPLAAPQWIKTVEKMPISERVDDLSLLPRIHWDGGIRGSWTPGEAGAQAQLSQFLEETVGDYDRSRDVPSEMGTSRLSPYLHFGEVSPRRVWNEITYEIESRRKGKSISNAGQKEIPNMRVYLRELGWREFAYHTLISAPHSANTSLKPEFENLRTATDHANLRAWQRGETGFPIVDAGMRELWTTGWMHNRVRMIVGSFLTKDLLIYWQEGAKWFWDTLVDADLANNTMGWQWVAGTGVDAMPYIRIFNPVTQSKKFDPSGDYIRKWVPELKTLSNSVIHDPWTVSSSQLQFSGVTLGREYPAPIVDHSIARARALSAFAGIRVKR